MSSREMEQRIRAIARLDGDPKTIDSEGEARKLKQLIETAVLKDTKKVRATLERKLRSDKMKKVNLHFDLIDHNGDTFPSYTFYVIFRAVAGDYGYRGIAMTYFKLVRDFGSFIISNVWAPPAFTLILKGFPDFKEPQNPAVHGAVNVLTAPGCNILRAYLRARQEQNQFDVTGTQHTAQTETAGSIDTTEETNELGGEFTLLKDVLKVGGKSSSKQSAGRSHQVAGTTGGSTAIRRGGTTGKPRLTFEKVSGALREMP